MIKLDEIALPGSTWNKTQDGEPVFVLAARDKLAPALVKTWVALARTHGVNQRKLAEAAELALKMEAWQRAYGSKVPD